MAFVLTPRFASAYQVPQYNPLGFSAPASRSPYACRVSRPQPRRSQYFLSQVDELLNEIDREAKRQAQLKAQREAELAARLEAQREAQRQLELQRQQELERRRALRAEFDVNQNEKGWQINGHFHGFDQENISVEMVDERTLKVAGNTLWRSEKAQPQPQQPQIEAAPTTEEKPNEHEVENATETDTTTAGAATPDSDTASHKSYQPTVEDDFEDLGDDATSSVSSSSTPAEPKEPKGKEKAVEEPITTETALVTQPQPEVPAQQSQEQPQQEKRVHGSFERTFRFPERIDVANVSASFKDGVLSITAPRAHVPQLRRITIS